MPPQLLGTFAISLANAVSLDHAVAFLNLHAHSLAPRAISWLEAENRGPVLAMDSFGAFSRRCYWHIRQLLPSCLEITVARTSLRAAAGALETGIVSAEVRDPAIGAGKSGTPERTAGFSGVIRPNSARNGAASSDPGSRGRRRAPAAGIEQKKLGNGELKRLLRDLLRRILAVEQPI